MNKRKFSAVKKELWGFLKKHSEFFEPLGCSMYLRDKSLNFTALHHIDIDTSKTCKECIKLDNVTESVLKMWEFDSLKKEFYQKFL